MQIFLARNNVQAGPYTLNQLNTMLATDEVSLDDLIWHEGMSQWQRLGDVTRNQRHYAPVGTSELISNSTPTVTNDTTNATTGERVSLEQLYGKPAKPTASDTPAKPTANRNPISLGKPGSKPATKSALGAVIRTANGQSVVLAPVMSRILALAINGLLYLLSVMPLLLALTKLDIDMERFQDFTNFDAAYQYTVTLMQSIPDSTIIMSQAMMFGLFAIQLFLIVMRGQSLGKVITGIRVVDQTTHKLPSLGSRLGIRTFLLIIIYNLVFSLTNFLGFALIALHYFMVSKSPENIGWHDKLAKTLVVKADNKQIEKTVKK